MSDTVNPQAFPGEVFAHFSIPDFDQGCTPSVCTGQSILSNKLLVTKPCVLFSRLNPRIARVWDIDGVPASPRSVASTEWVPFVIRDEAVLDRRYLYWFLRSERFLSVARTTAQAATKSRERADKKSLFQIDAPLPPLAEQKRIAAILDAADALRRKQQDALARIDRLRRSVFHTLLGRGAAGRDTWPVRQLGDLLTFITSGSRGWAALYAESGSAFIRIQNVGHDEMLLDDLAHVTPPDTVEARRTRVAAGDVLVSVTAVLGRTAVVPEGLGDAYINQHLVLLRVKDVDPMYLSAFLSSPDGQAQITKRNRYGVKAGLNFDDIRALRIPVPPRTPQMRYRRLIEGQSRLKKRLLRSAHDMQRLFESAQRTAFEGSDALGARQPLPHIRDGGSLPESLCPTLPF